MILITHAITGAALGNLAPSSFVAFLAGLISHYFLDAIPHYDYVDERFVDEPSSSRSRQILRFIILDGFIGVLLGLWIFGLADATSFGKIFWGIVGGLLPDALQGVQLYWPNKFTAWHNRTHRFLHFIVVKRPLLQAYPLSGLLMQVVIAAFFVILAKAFFL